MTIFFFSALFAESGLHIEEVCEKELVLSFALQRNITLERTELDGKFDECLYLEYLVSRTLLFLSTEYLYSV